MSASRASHKEDNRASYTRKSTGRNSLRYTDVSGGERRSTVLSQPLTYLPENLEKVGIDAEKSGCAASTAIAASSWNAMAGLGMVSMPWAFQEAGLLMGIILCAIAFILAYYTCILYVRTAGIDTDYTDTMRSAMGPTGRNLGMFCFIVNLLVPVILFFQLMAQALYPVILTFIDLATDSTNETISTDVDWSSFSYTWTCMLILVVEFVMTLRRDLDIYIKLNTVGVLGIIILMLYILVTGLAGIAQTDYTSSKDVYADYEQKIAQGEHPTYLAYISLFSSGYNRLMGILGGGFYLHNISLPIIARNPNPKTNERDLFIGYFMVFVTYVTFGVVGYLGFSAESYKSRWDQEANTIQENCLFMYPIAPNGWQAWVATFVRFSVFLHITTVNALLFACERAQILLLVTGQPETKSYAVQIFLNMAFITPAFLLAIYYPQVGDIAGILGATATMLVIYIVPNVTYLKMKWDATQRKIKGSKVGGYDYQIGLTKSDKEEGKDIRLSNVSSAVNDEVEDEKEEFENRIPPTSMTRFWLIAVGTLLVTSYGIFAFIMQFITV